MNRTYSRGDSRYKVTGRPLHYDVHVWCDCILGPHWHLIDRRETVKTAERLIDEHAFGQAVAT